MSETTVAYNGITIKNVLTEGIDHEVVQEGTGVDPIYVKITYTCSGIIHVVSPGINPTTIGLSVSSGGDLASGFNTVIAKLLEPRRPFAVQVGGSLILDVVPGAVPPHLQAPTAVLRKTDVNHGPIPSLKVLEIISANTMKIQFTVVSHLPYCDSSGSGVGGVISFRFWIGEDIDCEDWTTERIYQGTIRVRHLGHNVLTELRNNFMFPALFDGFQRRHITLNQRPNGLELDFTIRDKELWAQAPSPASDWSGNQTITCPSAAVMYSDIFVRLKGPKSVSKPALLQLAAKIIMHKVMYQDAAKLKQVFLQSITFNDVFRDNVVEASARVQLFGYQHVLLNIPKLRFGDPLKAPEFASYNKEKSTVYEPTASIKGLFLAYLNDPCHINGFPVDNEQARQAKQHRLDATTVSADDEPLADYTHNYSAEHGASAYNMYRMKSNTRRQEGIIQLPFGKSSSSSSDSAVILQLHKPIAQRNVLLEAERLEEWPSLPTGEEFMGPGGSRHVLMDWNQSPSAPVLSADGRKTLYHLIAEYTYAHNRAPAPGEIPAALMPYRIVGQNAQGQTNDLIFAVPASAYKVPQGFLTA